MKFRPEKGRPMKDFLIEAIEAVCASEEPISTSQLIERFDLNDAKAMQLRRALRNAQEREIIREVGMHSDKSLTWLSGDLSIARCAGHAANLFLDREKPDARIDPEKFESWWMNEKQPQT